MTSPASEEDDPPWWELVEEETTAPGLGDLDTFCVCATEELLGELAFFVPLDEEWD
jgi:hypothetical protein